MKPENLLLKIEKVKLEIKNNKALLADLKSDKNKMRLHANFIMMLTLKVAMLERKLERLENRFEKTELEK